MFAKFSLEVKKKKFSDVETRFLMPFLKECFGGFLFVITFGLKKKSMLLYILISF